MGSRWRLRHLRTASGDVGFHPGLKCVWCELPFAEVCEKQTGWQIRCNQQAICASPEGSLAGSGLEKLKAEVLYGSRCI